MNSLLLRLASLPVIALDFIAGPIAGVLGALIGLIFKRPWHAAPRWMFVVCIVTLMSFAQTPLLSPVMAQSSTDAAKMADGAMSEVVKSHLYQVIFQYHPEAKEEIRSSFQKIFMGPRDQFAIQSQQLGVTISNHYYSLHVATASDAAIHKILESNSRIIEALKEPKSCVGYYLGTVFNASDIPADLVQSELNARIEVIESSAKSPFHREKLSAEKIILPLLASYEKNGLARDKALAEIKNLGTLNSLPPEEGCAVARHFSAALASMDEKTAAAVFISLTALGK